MGIRTIEQGVRVVSGQGALRTFHKAEGRRTTSFDATLVIVASILFLATALVLAEPASTGLGRSAALQLITVTGLTFVAAITAVLAWIRYREARRIEALFEAGAFLAAAALNVLLIIDALEQISGSARGLSAEAVVAFTLTRAAIAALTIIGAVLAIRAVSPLRLAGRTTLLVLLAPTVTIVGVVVVGSGSGLLVRHEDFISAVLLGRQGFVGAELFLQLTIASGLLMAAFLYRRLYLQTGRVASAYVTVGLLLAARSQIQFAMRPEAIIASSTIEGLTRVAAYAAVVIGSAVQVRHDVRSLRHANREIKELRDAELAHAALVERNRFAREIHDGLAQDIVVARMRVAMIRSSITPDAATAALIEQTDRALKRALSDTRRTLTALRSGRPRSSALAAVLGVEVNTFRERFAIPASITTTDLPFIPSTIVREVALITREALRNVGAHSRASSVEVSVDMVGRGLRVRVRDDGVGFDTSSRAITRYGLQGMQERASLAGGRLSITSGPGRGTVISLIVSLAPRSWSTGPARSRQHRGFVRRRPLESRSLVRGA